MVTVWVKRRGEHRFESRPPLQGVSVESAPVNADSGFSLKMIKDELGGGRAA